MKKIILVLVVSLLSASSQIKAQDLISGGSNNWIFHTPDDGRTTLHIAPKKNGTYDWGAEFKIKNNGEIITNSLNVKGDIFTSGGNDWIIHSPGNTQGNLHFAPKIDGGIWNWDRQIYFTKEADLIVDGKIGIGTRNPTAKLTVNGKILCEEVEVIQNVLPDYVFQKYYTGASSLKADYKMATLEEVEAFTKANHHLPDVPSAKVVKEEGLQLKEMTTILLQKIEELTLYTIEQEKRIKALEADLAK